MGKVSDRGRIAHLEAEIAMIDRMTAKYEAQRAEKLAEIQRIEEKAAATA